MSHYLHSIERLFFHVKIFNSLSHADSLFTGASDPNRLTLYRTYVLLARPAEVQLLDVYQRSDQGWISKELMWSVTTSAPHQRRTAGPNAGLSIPTFVSGIRKTKHIRSPRIGR
jgi:hypothetical protein